MIGASEPSDAMDGSLRVFQLNPCCADICEPNRKTISSWPQGIVRWPRPSGIQRTDQHRSRETDRHVIHDQAGGDKSTGPLAEIRVKLVRYVER